MALPFLYQKKPEDQFTMILPCLYEGKHYTYPLKATACPICHKAIFKPVQNVVDGDYIYHPECYEKAVIHGKVAFLFTSPHHSIKPIRGFDPIPQ